MKKRDTILFGLPLVAVLLIAAFAAFLYWQIAGFEKIYTAETQKSLEQEARLVSAVITPLLNERKISEAVHFCDGFDSDTLRVTLIDAKGKVAADSSEKIGFFGNHLDREEVRSALSGKPLSSLRYSESLGQWMLYHAVPLQTKSGTYVLRAAVSTDQVSRIIDMVRLNMFWALLFGCEIVIVLACYIAKRVRKPLLALHSSVNAIASGNLNSHIEIPESGIVRELAAGISEMTEQLKTQINDITVERNEKNALLETMSEAVLLFAPDGSLVRANRAASAFFEFSGNGEKFNLSRCQIPELLTLAHKTFRTGEPFEQEFSLQRGGIIRSLFIKGRLLDDDGSRRLLLTATELTNLRKLESFRSDFIANVSHEIKTPLTCILGAVETLEDDSELPPDLRAKLMDMLKKQSRRLNNLVQDILSLAALEKKQADTARDFTEIALDSIVVNAVNLCTSHAAEAKIKLRIEENLPLIAKGDSCLIEQALVNLIENAVKYSEGSAIAVSLKREEHAAVIEVKDNGVGIPPEHQKRIFERFYRVDKSRSRELGGTGLGLAIVKHIVQLHHGTASVESSPGKGASFRIELPLE